MTDLFATLAESLAREFGDAIRAVPIPTSPADTGNNSAATPYCVPVSASSTSEAC